MKRALGHLLPVVVFIAFSYWMYDAVFARRTMILLRNIGEQPCDSVVLHMEWDLYGEEQANAGEVVGVERDHHHFGSIQPGEWRAIDREIPASIPRIKVFYRAADGLRSHSFEEFASGIIEIPIELDLNAAADSLHQERR